MIVATGPLAMPDFESKFTDMPTAIAKRRNVKSEAIKLVRGLPSSSTWDDLLYRFYVRQKIEAGFSDFRDGRTHSHESIREEFALR